MRNSLILASCALCVVIISAVPLPSANNELEVVQIPLQGNKEIDILSLPENTDGQLTERNKRTIGILRDLFPELSRATMTAAATANNEEPSVDLAALSERLDSINRVVRNTQSQQQPAPASSGIVESLPSSSPAASSTPDALSAASDVNELKSKAPAIDELTLDDEENDENRNKRFLSFGLSGNSGGSGGSGNFLFDIIRRTADRAARAAGTVYRVAAGTESLDIINESTHGGTHPTTKSTAQAAVAIGNGDAADKLKQKKSVPAAQQQQQKQQQRSIDGDTDNDSDASSRQLTTINGLSQNGLVGGSAGTEQTDEHENAPEGEVTVAKQGDGYTEGIPGPVTRLFVLANRGLANLIQDLILRIAQTSERVVNFKARLITSLI